LTNISTILMTGTNAQTINPVDKGCGAIGICILVESVHFLLSSGYLCIALRDPVITGRGLSCVCPKISNIIYRGLWWLFVLLILVEYVGHHCLNCNFIILVEYRFIRKAHFCRFFLHNCCFALDIYVFYYKTEMYSHSFHTANRYSCYVQGRR
jgi:hypothetical protein